MRIGKACVHLGRNLRHGFSLKKKIPCFEPEIVRMIPCRKIFVGRNRPAQPAREHVHRNKDLPVQHEVAVEKMQVYLWPKIAGNLVPRHMPLVRYEHVISHGKNL